MTKDQRLQWLRDYVREREREERGADVSFTNNEQKLLDRYMTACRPGLPKFGFAARCDLDDDLTALAKEGFLSKVFDVYRSRHQ